MNNQLLMLLLLGGAAVLYFSSRRSPAPGQYPGPGSGLPPGPGSQTGSASGPSSGSASGSASGSQASPVSASIRSMTDHDVLVRAAAGDEEYIQESSRRNLVLSHHQWNWYRALTKGDQPDPELWAPGSTGELVSAVQYFAMRSSTGLGYSAPAYYWRTLQ